MEIQHLKYLPASFISVRSRNSEITTVPNRLMDNTVHSKEKKKILFSLARHRNSNSLFLYCHSQCNVLFYV